MNKIIKKIVICNFTKTISSAVLTAVAVNIIMTNATKWSLIEGLIPFALAIVIVVLIDIYEYDVSVKIRLIWMNWKIELKNWKVILMKGKILIAVPTFENIKPECFKSIYGLTNPKGFNLYFDYVKGYDCARARNEIAKLALNYNFDYVLMVDSDVSVPKETLNELLDCKTDIALGWYYKKRTRTDETVIFDFGKDFNNQNMIYAKTLMEANDPFEIKGGGLGISLINVNVFRKMAYPYFKYVIYDNDTVLSEDLYFCSEARKYGMNIKCNPNIKGDHIYEVLM